MSDGKKAAYEEEQDFIYQTRLKAVARLRPEQLLALQDRLDVALQQFPPGTPLTRSQHDAIDAMKQVVRSFTEGSVK